MCACDSGTEPVCGTHRMVPLSKGSALRPREYDDVCWPVCKFSKYHIFFLQQKSLTLV